MRIFRIPAILALALTAACADDGSFTTDSGLEIEVLREGEGARPAASDLVVVHYRGTLTDGTQFDSSYDRDQPATFAVNGLIDGFSETLMLMPVGSHYRVAIPSELGYGEMGMGDAIGPNEDLIFEIELLEIVGG